MYYMQEQRQFNLSSKSFKLTFLFVFHRKLNNLFGFEICIKYKFINLFRYNFDSDLSVIVFRLYINLIDIMIFIFVICLR